MNFEETSQLLAKIQMSDSRNVDPGVILTWSEILAGVPLQDGLDALLAYHQSGQTGWIMPGHIIQLVAKQKDRNRELLHAAGPPDYPSDLSQAEEKRYRILYQTAVKAGRTRAEATAHADREFGAQRLPEIEAPPEVRAAITDFERKRAIPPRKKGDAA